MAVLALVFVLLTPLAMVYSLYATATWRGRWRVLAAVPWLALVAYFAVVLIPAWTKDPTSHNLFPFELAINLAPATIFIAVVGVMHRRVVGPAATGPLVCAACGATSRPGPSVCEACGGRLRRG